MKHNQLIWAGLITTGICSAVASQDPVLFKQSEAAVAAPVVVPAVVPAAKPADPMKPVAKPAPAPQPKPVVAKKPAPELAPIIITEQTTTNYWTQWPWMATDDKPSKPAGVREPAEPAIQRLSLAARFGFGISAKFSGVSPIAIPASTRTTPDGATYNYDNGYVLNDSSDGANGDTWNIGYDDSASQVNTANNTISFSRSTGTASLSAPKDRDDFALGAEVTYTRQLGEDQNQNFRYGFELAGNYINTSIRSANPYALRGDIQTDAYAYTPGTTPPTATPGAPYLSTFNGPGFILGNTPVSTSTSVGATVGNVTGSRSLEADLWGARLGPYLEYYLDKDETFSLGLSGGLALGYLSTDVAWNETIAITGGGTITDTGSGSDSSFRVGFYVAANALWRLDDHWGVMGSVQYQNLGTYEKVFGTRKAELDLSKSIFVTVGVSYSF